MTSCNVVVGYRRFGGPTTTLHDVTTKNTSTSNFHYRESFKTRVLLFATFLRVILEVPYSVEALLSVSCHGAEAARSHVTLVSTLRSPITSTGLMKRSTKQALQRLCTDISSTSRSSSHSWLRLYVHWIVSSSRELFLNRWDFEGTSGGLERV
jgi:hypothetical protein